MATSLLDWIMTLIKDTEAREAFQADPKAAMSAAGMSSICGDDIRDARPFLLDNPSVKQVRPYEPAEHKDTSEQIREIVENHRERDGHKEREEKEYREEEVVFKSKDGTKIEDSYHQDSYNKYTEIEDSYNRYSEVEDNDIVTGPASGKQSTSADQSDSTVGENQTSVGGSDNFLGSNNDLSSTKVDNSNTEIGNDIQGNGNAGRDMNLEQGGDVDVREDSAGRDADDIGGLIGFKDFIDINQINVLSNLVNLNGDVLSRLVNLDDQSALIDDGLLNDLDLTDVAAVAVAGILSNAAASV